MGEWIGDNIGIIEMAFTGAVVLGLCAWQYWQVRDAGKPPRDGD